MSFKIGDKVRVINYGHLVSANNHNIVDVYPEMVGKEGVIVKKVKTQNLQCYDYELGEIQGKCAWYDEGKLEKINSKRSFIKWYNIIKSWFK